jgi:flagellar protein FlbD
MEASMVFLTRLDGTEFVVNLEHVVTVERTPDTVVTLTTGARLMVREKVEDVIAKAIWYRRWILTGPHVVGAAAIRDEE